MKTKFSYDIQSILEYLMLRIMGNLINHSNATNIDDYLTTDGPELLYLFFLTKFA